jgi:hypothetical protein
LWQRAKTQPVLHSVQELQLSADGELTILDHRKARVYPFFVDISLRAEP